MAKLTPERLDRMAVECRGKITSVSADGRMVVAEFPISTRAASFYDDVVTSLRTDEGVEFSDAARCVVVVTLPEEG